MGRVKLGLKLDLNYQRWLVYIVSGGIPSRLAVIQRRTMLTNVSDEVCLCLPLDEGGQRKTAGSKHLLLVTLNADLEKYPRKQ